jgi:hypothetical protein
MTALVFGTSPFPNQSGDKIVSKAVSAAISALFKRTGKIEANVRAEPVAKLLQGSVDGFDFIGNGMLMYNGLRIEDMELYVEVKLRQPTQATMRVMLTEEDLTNSFNTPFVVEKLQKLEYEGQSLNFQNTKMKVNDDKSLGIQCQISLGKQSEIIEVDITAQLQVEERRKLQFVDVVYQGNEQAIALGKALIDHVNALLDLDKFALDGTQLRVDRIRVRNQQIIFYGMAKIDQFPQRK